jgi:hypothetical protein
MVSGDGLDLAIHVAAVRFPGGSQIRLLQGAAMLAAAGLNALSARTMRLLFRRVLFHSQPARWQVPFSGAVVRLDRHNLLQAALASGTVPLHMEPMREIPGLPTGRFLDGGLTDYHLNQRYLGRDQGIVLFPHFQRRIVPNWFDRYLQRRRPKDDALACVLQIHPSEEFVASLPGGAIPTRDDFVRMVDRPEERMRLWREVASRSLELGEQLLDDVRKGRIPDLTEPI